MYLLTDGKYRHGEVPFFGPRWSLVADGHCYEVEIEMIAPVTRILEALLNSLSTVAGYRTAVLLPAVCLRVRRGLLKQAHPLCLRSVSAASGADINHDNHEQRHARFSASSITNLSESYSR